MESPFEKIGNYSLLNYSYVNGLFSLGARADFELDRLTFVERLETLLHNSRKMYENLLAVLRRSLFCYRTILLCLS